MDQLNLLAQLEDEEKRKRRQQTPKGNGRKSKVASSHVSYVFYSSQFTWITPVANTAGAAKEPERRDVLILSLHLKPKINPKPSKLPSLARLALSNARSLEAMADESLLETPPDLTRSLSSLYQPRMNPYLPASNGTADLPSGTE
jgi:hypothetical protein